MSAKETTGGRVLSIDALRGFDMFWIMGAHGVVLGLLPLLHNMPNGLKDAIRGQMDHARWEGFTAWDLIMPLFLFIVGAAMPFSFAKQTGAGHSRVGLYLKVFRRVLLLWVLGMVAQGNVLDFRLDTLQLFSNTLQAIAVGYLVAAILLVNLPIAGQVVVTALLLAAYWAVMVLVPGAHAAGWAEGQNYLPFRIDAMVIGRFRDLSPSYTYAWILPSLGYSANVLLGVMSGHLLRSGRTPAKKLVWLIALGLGCLLLGWLIAGGFITWAQSRGHLQSGWSAHCAAWAWEMRFPIIKHLATSSMILWAAGWCYLLLALFYVVLDVLQFRAWAFPFIVIGANAITAYMICHPPYFRRTVDAYLHGLADHCGPHANLVLSAGGLVTVWLILYVLYRNKKFLRV